MHFNDEVASDKQLIDKALPNCNPQRKEKEDGAFRSGNGHSRFDGLAVRLVAEI